MKSSSDEILFHDVIQHLRDLTKADPEDQIIITSSGAEGINHVVFSAYLDISRQTGKNHFIAGRVDEAPAILAMSRLQQLGCIFQMAEADKHGKATVESISDALSPRTALISLSWANALTGVIQPIEEIGALCKERGILFHVDATNVLGKGDFFFKDSGADVITFDGFVKGAGVLLVKKGVNLSPFILGGFEQQGLRAGSLSSNLLHELCLASRQKLGAGESFCMETAHRRFLFEELIQGLIPAASILFREEARLPDVTVATFPKISGELLGFRLYQAGITTSIGGGTYQKLHHVLAACGIDHWAAHSALSFSFTPDMHENEIRFISQAISEKVNQLQRYSSHLTVL